MQVNRYKPASEIEGVNLMKIGTIAAIVIVGLLVAALITFVIVPSLTSEPDATMTYAAKIETPMFVDVDGDKDTDLLLPGGYIVYNNPQLEPPTK